MSYQVIPCDSIPFALEETVRLITRWVHDVPKLCWFRGVRDTTLSLKPGAYWRQNYDEMEPLLDLIQEGVAFSVVGDLDQWDTYYFAQHHGIPTRLLDWTESFIAALFFAFDRWDESTTPCVWILQPGRFNEVFIKWNGIIAPDNDSCSSAWLPKKIAETEPAICNDKDGYTYRNTWPLAIHPRKANKRIIAQQGAFTVHGKSKRSLDELIDEASGDPSEILAKIELTGFTKSRVMEELYMLGVRRSAIYPDIDNFVLQLKEYYKWD